MQFEVGQRVKIETFSGQILTGTIESNTSSGIKVLSDKFNTRHVISPHMVIEIMPKVDTPRSRQIGSDAR